MSDATNRERIVSLDQFRGYTVLGMFVVNFIGGFDVTPHVLKHHHTYCSYADTIMPQFLFAVGFAFRLTFSRRAEREGRTRARLRVIRRVASLALVSVLIYGASAPAATWSEFQSLGIIGVLQRALKREWFQTLMHIAATSLWILPWIETRVSVRSVFAVSSGLLHVWLSWWFNFHWCNSAPNAIDGGPLGFLTWTIPAIVGTIACDVITTAGSAQSATTVLRRLLPVAAGLMCCGWLLSCGTRFYDIRHSPQTFAENSRLAAHPVVPDTERWSFPGFAEPPFCPPPGDAERKWNYWMMSQRAGTLTYLTFSAGFSLFVWLVLEMLWKVVRFRWTVFERFGSNALVGYIFHLVAMDALHPFMPDDSPLWYVTAGLTVFLILTWTFTGWFTSRGIRVRL